MSRGTLKILGPSGHQALEWDNLKPETRAKAEAMFLEAKQQGHTGYLMDKAKVGHKVDELPLEGDIVMAPRLVGG